MLHTNNMHQLHTGVCKAHQLINWLRLNKHTTRIHLLMLVTRLTMIVRQLPLQVDMLRLLSNHPTINKTPLSELLFAVTAMVVLVLLHDIWVARFFILSRFYGINTGGNQVVS